MPAQPDRRSGDPGRLPPPGGGRAEEALQRHREDFLQSLRNGPAAGEPPEARIERTLRNALLTGALRGGDRLPSLREIAAACGISRHATARAFRALADADLVEPRERSGVYVSRVCAPAEEPRPATARWLVDVLVQAYQEHRIKVTHLPELIRKWTGSVPLQAACFESVTDLRVALAREVSGLFGLGAWSVALPLSPGADGSTAGDGVPGSGGDPAAADLWVTTSYHAVELQPPARAEGKPLLAATLNPLILDALADWLGREGGLTVVCVDGRFGERIRLIHGGRWRDRIRVVETDDLAAVDALDRTVPVLLTSAARARLGPRGDFRMVAPESPCFSPEFTRTLLTLVVRLNVERARVS